MNKEKFEAIVIEVFAWLSVIAFFAAIALLICGCSEMRYIPVETVKTEIVHVHDTIKQSDSIKSFTNTIIREARPEDSAMIAQLGVKLRYNERLLILLQKELQENRSKTQLIRNKDSLRIDSIQVPYPVERKLSKWETFCIDYGKVMIGSTIVVIFFFIIFVLILARRKLVRF